jgi:tripartite-type tricarboxylate transporter receptor subunit TctC
MKPRQFLRFAAGAAALPAISPDASGQTYPSRPITMIVPAAAGGPTDELGRLRAERMRGSLGRPIIIQNVTGDRAAGAKPAIRLASFPYLPSGREPDPPCIRNPNFPDFD